MTRSDAATVGIIVAGLVQGNVCFHKYDCDIYKCSTITHLFGIVLPLYMLVVTLLFVKGRSSFSVHAAAAFLSATMLSFHLSYETRRRTHRRVVTRHT